MALLKFGQYTEAIDSFNRVIEIDPDDEIARNNRNFALQQKKLKH
jgi:lipoprotein NlpI